MAPDSSCLFFGQLSFHTLDELWLGAALVGVCPVLGHVRVFRVVPVVPLVFLASLKK